MLSQSEVIATIPKHLQPFVAHQNYHSYTPRDQAVWRFVVSQLVSQLQGLAHPTFFRGLSATGITTEAIPRIEVLNHALGAMGWRAVVVDGFVPPAVFMEFQAHRVLPIAVNIRSLDHILYTPAPDIIHEAVGHAPFIVDVDYAEFLQRFGELGMRAVSDRHDRAVYEAVRGHSIVMESPRASEQERQASARTLEKTLAEKSVTSEAALLSRLHWWTVEYGLVGDLNESRIFGAGLLSSLGESRDCLHSQSVEKIPLTVNVIRRDYDITREQPQLYVTDNCLHLSQVLHEFARGMCCQQGGAESVRKAIAAETVNTARLDTGIEISGVFHSIITDAVDNLCYLQTAGPTQLAFEGRQIPGHGIDTHRQGYGTALGNLKSMTRCLSACSVDELALHGIEIGRAVALDFVSGISVRGKLEAIRRESNRNILFSFSGCRVQGAEGTPYFKPEWGDYDLAIGESVVSLFGGASDKDAYPLYTAPSGRATPAPLCKDEDEQLALYHRLRQCRESGVDNAREATAIGERIAGGGGCDWLLCYEALELARVQHLPGSLCEQLQHSLKEKLHGEAPELRALVESPDFTE